MEICCRILITMSTVKTANKQTKPNQFQPGQSGNPAGRPKGSRGKATQLAEWLIDNDAEAIITKVINEAKNGDMSAAKILIDRILPPRRDRHVSVALPEIKNASDAASAMAAVINEVAAGNITAGEAEGLTKLIGEYSKILEVSQFEERLKRLEEAAG